MAISTPVRQNMRSCYIPSSHHAVRTLIILTSKRAGIFHLHHVNISVISYQVDHKTII